MLALWASLLRLLSNLWAPVAAWALGHEQQKRQQSDAQVRAEATRREVENAVSQDPDLVARARRVGLVRPERND